MQNGNPIEQKRFEIHPKATVGELFSERLLREKDERSKLVGNLLTFGIDYLDDVFGGILPNDLILIGAKTGVGKTQLATQIAYHNALTLKKRVHFFALEAEPAELERRMMYRILADEYFGSQSLRDEIRTRHPGRKIHLNYVDWYLGKLDFAFKGYEESLKIAFAKNFDTLVPIYRGYGDYTIEDFIKQFTAIKHETDLVVVDHLHYFDFDDDNENRAIKRIVKSLRDLALYSGKPVILIAHLRKTDARFASPMPVLEDFQGSSDISKIGTKAIMLAPAYDQIDNFKDGNRLEVPTYVQASKFRMDTSRTRYTALLKFDDSTKAYSGSYRLGKFSREKDGYQFNQIQKGDSSYPYWAKK